MAAPNALKREKVRQRAVRLLEGFFTNDGERGRQTVFNAAFGDCERDPRRAISWSGSAIEFGDQAVEKLLAFGCADRGRHSLSLLLATMAEIRGRQTDPDYSELPILLDQRCALPTRDEERKYLDRLRAEIEQKARLYAPLRGIAEMQPAPYAETRLAPWRDDEDIALLLDGLNEVPTATRAAKAADLLALNNTLPKDTPFIVSCRRDDYVGDLDLGLDTLSLEPLSPQRIRAVICHWLPEDAEGVEPDSAERLFWQLAGDERLAGVLATWLAAGATEEAFWSVSDPQDDDFAYAKTSGEEDEIWRRHIPDPRSLLRLAANPFMLTMLFQVWAFEGELPRNRGDLFARFIDRLLSREGLLVKQRETGVWQRTHDGERLLSDLTGIAWIMQDERLDPGEQKESDFGVLTVVPRAIAVQKLGSEAMLKKAEDATLLEGGAEIRFRHQLLQEYFTASAMQVHIEDTPPMRASELWPVEH